MGKWGVLREKLEVKEGVLVNQEEEVKAMDKWEVLREELEVEEEANQEEGVKGMVSQVVKEVDNKEQEEANNQDNNQDNNQANRQAIKTKPTNSLRLEKRSQVHFKKASLVEAKTTDTMLTRQTDVKSSMSVFLNKNVTTHSFAMKD